MARMLYGREQFMPNIKKLVAISVALLAITGCNQKEKDAIDKDLLTLAKTDDTYICSADPSWIIDPNNPPAEIPLGENAQICQFYQFSWQWFINLMYAPNGTERNYQSQANYPVFVGPTNNSCTNNVETSKLFVRTQKDAHTTAEDFTLPTGENQALSDAVIYDQNGNIVLYEARFDRNMCNVAQGSKTLPAGTTEIKSSWRKITEAEKPEYVWLQSDTNANGTLDSDEIYGLVGFHLVKSTALHPEFIWATFEHRKNAPDCQKKGNPASDKNWSFASESCAGSLPNPTANCEFNKTLDHDSSPSMTGTPTEICQVYAQGTNPGDNQSEKNRDNIITINAELNVMFNLLPEASSLAVLKHYELVGGIWENDVTKPSSDESNLRGSIQLANTTMETNAQQGFGTAPGYDGIPYTGPTNLQPAAQCFDCHGYSGPDSNAQVSHIFSKIHGSSK